MLRTLRFAWSVSCEATDPELAMTVLNRKMRPVLKKLRKRHYEKPSKIKYDNRLKARHRASYRRVQNLLTHIEIERTLSARRRKAGRTGTDDYEPTFVAEWEQLDRLSLLPRSSLTDGRLRPAASELSRGRRNAQQDGRGSQDEPNQT